MTNVIRISSFAAHLLLTWYARTMPYGLNIFAISASDIGSLPDVTELLSEPMLTIVI